MAEIPTKYARRYLSPDVREWIEVTAKLVAQHKDELVAEKLAHEMTRGDLLVARARIRELEDELGLIEAEVPTERPERTGVMKAAEKTEDDFDA